MRKTKRFHWKKINFYSSCVMNVVCQECTGIVCHGSVVAFFLSFLFQLFYDQLAVWFSEFHLNPPPRWCRISISFFSLSLFIFV